MPRIVIRNEQQGDEPGIAAVVQAAFERPDEARLVEQLRTDGAAVLSLVAVAEGMIVGHAMFSRMTAPFRALGLAPASVAPTTQRQGIGRSLIEAGLTQARQLGWEVVFVLGDPAYYSRFGFRVDLAQGFSCAYAGSHFMALPLGAHLPIGKGHIEYAPAFSRISSEPI